MTRLLILISLISALIAGRESGVFAQTTTTLSGNVTDAATGKLMPFANVYPNNTTHGTVSDIKGHFVLTVGLPCRMAYKCRVH